MLHTFWYCLCKKTWQIDQFRRGTTRKIFFKNLVPRKASNIDLETFVGTRFLKNVEVVVPHRIWVRSWPHQPYIGASHWAQSHRCHPLCKQYQNVWSISYIHRANTVLFRPIVHGVWHMTAIVHWATCSHLPVTNDNRKNCSCARWWPEMFIQVNNATVTEDPSGPSRNDQTSIVQECRWDEKTENWMATSMSNIGGNSS